MMMTLVLFGLVAALTLLASILAADRKVERDRRVQLERWLAEIEKARRP